MIQSVVTVLLIAGIVLSIGCLWLDSVNNSWKLAHDSLMEHAKGQVGCPQANRCYDWEEHVVGPKLRKLGLGEWLNIDEARTYIKEVCKVFGYKVPVVKESDFNGLPVVGMSVNGNLILLKNKTDRMVILHELAHMFLSQDGKPFEAHNEVFLEKYIQLLEWAGLSDLRRTLHAWALGKPYHETKIPLNPFDDTEVATTQHGVVM